MTGKKELLFFFQTLIAKINLKSPLRIPQPASDVFSVDSPPLTYLEKNNKNILPNVSFRITRKKVSHAGL